MGETCQHCGAELNDNTEICPGCGANIRAERAESKAEMLEEALGGWRRKAEETKVELRERALVLEQNQFEDYLKYFLERLIGVNHRPDSPCFNKLDLDRVYRLILEEWKDLVSLGMAELDNQMDGACRTYCDHKQRGWCALNGQHPRCHGQGVEPKFEVHGRIPEHIAEKARAVLVDTINSEVAKKMDEVVSKVQAQIDQLGEDLDRCANYIPDDCEDSECEGCDRWTPSDPRVVYSKLIHGRVYEVMNLSHDLARPRFHIRIRYPDGKCAWVWRKNPTAHSDGIKRLWKKLETAKSYLFAVAQGEA